MAIDRTDDELATLLEPIRGWRPAPDDIEVVVDRGRRIRRNRRVTSLASYVVPLAVVACLVVAVAHARQTSPIDVSTGDEGRDRGASLVDGTGAAEVPASFRLTPAVADLPSFPDDAILEAAAATVPPERHQRWVSDLPGTRTVWAPTDQQGNVFPVFHHDGRLAGIFVSNLGIVTRSDYESSGFDPEVALRDRVGPEEYERQRRAVWASLQELPPGS